MAAILALMMAGWTSGCAKYAPLPLNSGAVERALALPSAEQIRERIAALHNPLLHAGAFDLDDGMSPGEAAVLAVVLNPSLSAERSRVGLARAQQVQARLLPNPTLSFNLDQPFGSNSAGQVSAYGLGLEWELTALISHGAKVKASEAAGEQVRLNVAWKEWQVAEAARQALLDVVALREQQADAEQLFDQLTRIADRARQALQNHDLTASDASTALAAAAEAEVSLASINRDLRDAELALNRAIGLPPQTQNTLETSVTLPTNIALGDSSTFTRNLESRRIDLVALHFGYDSQESSVRAAVLSQFPKISLGISQTRDYGNFLTLGPALTAELPFFDRNQGNIAIERATRAQLYHEYIARIFEARADIAREAALIGSLNTVIAAQSRQVMALRELVAADEKALEHGNLAVATFYAAAVSLSQKQTDLIKLKQDLVHALIDLELASGAEMGDAWMTQAPRPEPKR